ncbi:carboxymuconolactone decarboxylase family protein [Salinimonas chungwhensis]|uniref:carboxymuconolactone decarboxylase family protein n=1 Tax=Salinimonas chungwhensis TaxID=265425 RepID=UPI0003A4F823|nr:carboxymuconolactone decarboxylase family protein [Salinimonas chungwhensis]
MMKSSKIPDEAIDALRNGTALPDTKLQALHDFTKALLDNRGHMGDDKLNESLSAGYTKRQALEVFTGLVFKLTSDFTNALTHTEVVDAMKPYT